MAEQEDILRKKIEVGISMPGIQGRSGKDGADGAQGPEGPVGPQGPKGDDGIDGTQGLLGEQGLTGEQGLIGPQGNTGLVGPLGETGLQGEIGLIGPAGAVGPQGAIGSIGPQGTEGEKGGKGDQGSQGGVGLQGSEGPKGPQGPGVGAQGPRGKKGMDCAVSFEYVYFSSILDFTPPNGKLSLDSETQANATFLRASWLDEGGAEVEAYLGTVDDSTSPIKGYVRLTKDDESGKWILFQINSTERKNDYYKIIVQKVAYSDSNPFDEGDSLIASFDRVGDKGDKGEKNAIVKSHRSDAYVALSCVEMPETRFDDIIVAHPGGAKRFWIDIDQEYLFVCEEETIKPISYVASSPCVCGIEVEGSEIKIDIEGEVPCEIVIKLSGIRKGCGSRRFVEYTREEAERNFKFWSSWKNS